MRTYYAIVHKDRDSCFGISFPDLPGCFSAADDENRIFEEAQTALSLFVSDEVSAPVARSVAQLRSDPSVKAEIESGAFLIAVPVIFVNKKARFNLMLAEDLVAGVDATAQTLGLSRSEFIAGAVKDRLTHQVGAVVLRVSNAAGQASRASKAEKAVAASALTQTKSKKETTGKAVASAAAKILHDPKASKEAKSVSASALTQKVKKK